MKMLHCFSVVATLLVLLPSSSNAAQSGKLSELEDRIQHLESSVEWLASKVDRGIVKEWALLDCEKGASQTLMPSNGNMAFTATCNDVEPYLEGFKLKLRIGNPYAFDATAVTVSVSHGKTLSEALTAPPDEVGPISVLPSGAWKNVDVVVNPAKPADVRTIILKLRIGGLSGSLE